MPARASERLSWSPGSSAAAPRGFPAAPLPAPGIRRGTLPSSHSLLGAAARFIHFALFHGELLSAPSYACDTLILFIVGLLAWRATRASQMVRQYPWLYTRAGPLQWRKVGREDLPRQ